jgi:hypothetical protein
MFQMGGREAIQRIAKPIEARGFEPPTLCSQSRYATKSEYTGSTPVWVAILKWLFSAVFKSSGS